MKKQITIEKAYAINCISFANITEFTQALKKQCQDFLYQTYCKNIARMTCHLIDYSTICRKDIKLAQTLQPIMSQYITDALKEGLTSPTDHRHITNEELFAHIQTAYLPIYRLAMQAVMYQAKRAQLLANTSSETNADNYIILFPAKDKTLCIAYGHALCNSIMPTLISKDAPKAFSPYNIQEYNYSCTQKPDNITEEEYKQRYQDWSQVIKTSNPKNDGVVIQIADHDKLASSLYFLQPNELMPYINNVGRIHFFDHTLFKANMNKIQQPPYDFYRQALSDVLTEITPDTLMKQAKEFIPKLL